MRTNAHSDVTVRAAQASGRAPAGVFKVPSRARVERVRRRLLAYYGRPTLVPHGEPLSELVLTVLSQSTNDRNRDRAFFELRRRFQSWEEVRLAPLAKLEEALRPGGIAKVKSRRIKQLLEVIHDTAPDPDQPLSLAWLATAERDQARRYLTSLPGVGRKTAACVLLFSFGIGEVPVDTHVARVGRRLGLLPQTGDFDRLHDLMAALSPPAAELELHVNLLRHGRRICASRRPACGRCPLVRLCPSWPLFEATRRP